jgi:hypothetical protein
MFENNVNGTIPYGRMIKFVSDRCDISNIGDECDGVCRPYNGSAICGNAPNSFDWVHKYETNVYGETIYEEVEVTDDKTGKKSMESVKKINPAFDPNLGTYIPRYERRDEWSCIEVCGRCVCELESGVNENNYIEPGKDGIGAKSGAKTNVKVLKLVQEESPRLAIVFIR